MALKLTIIEDQRGPPGRGGSIVFGVAGGGIGRAHDNDWVLPDPQRYLSAHHARVQFRDGTYFLIDTSTNGVFVNDAHGADRPAQRLSAAATGTGCASGTTSSPSASMLPSAARRRKQARSSRSTPSR